MRTVTKEEIKVILDNHRLWLKTGHKQGKRANLSFCDLHFFDLSDRVFDYADLSRANLECSNLSHSSFNNTNLYDAKLMLADLSYCDFTSANLDDVQCKSTKFQCSMFSDCTFRFAHADWTNFSNTQFFDVNFDHATMFDCDFTSSLIRNCSLVDTAMTACKLEKLRLSNTNMQRFHCDKKYYQVSGIGSRRDITIYCLTDDLVYCGCWNDDSGGSLKSFEERVEEKYGPSSKTTCPRYYDEYMAAIKFFKSLTKYAKEQEVF